MGDKMALALKNVKHYPTLETVLMVEDFIRKHSAEYTKYQIWKRLPRRMIYQTYCVIFDYLLASNKIAVDSVGKVGWIWNPELVRKYLKRKDLTWRPPKTKQKSR
jgi:hypothetical protein